ncbi:hypothetical protein COLO4_12217 [Corchorus olitorius]|uniref:Uncharacterized protein n=1 Tax=Corchorus olitorius TaxID=93759 RepID=A0A1R3K1R3_9ROSI|nr:hypothetical protein COLO4_12217 [Corchorus olitorius]
MEVNPGAASTKRAKTENSGEKNWQLIGAASGASGTDVVAWVAWAIECSRRERCPTSEAGLGLS